MKKLRVTLIGFMMMVFAAYSTDATAQSTGAAVAKKVGVYVFPAKGQTQDQQNKDESDCYTWAVQQSGYDPINPTVVQAQQVQTGPDGSAIRGSAKGALTGAAIGAISGDAGKGASIGAIGGAVLGHRRGRMRKSMEQAGADEAAGQQSQNLVEGFKKAFSVCLEGKGYTVK
ncbi:MAG: glycine zipper domain-containing protein [Bacteroidota bacterium]